MSNNLALLLIRKGQKVVGPRFFFFFFFELYVGSNAQN